MSEGFASYSSTLTADAAAGDALLSVASVTALPGAPFRLKLDSEIVLVTSITGSAAAPKVSVQRGYEGSTPAAHPTNTVIRTVITAGMLIALSQPPVALPRRGVGDRQYLSRTYGGA
jgi:hypothetical protein